MKLHKISEEPIFSKKDKNFSIYLIEDDYSIRAMTYFPLDKFWYLNGKKASWGDSYFDFETQNCRGWLYSSEHREILKENLALNWAF
ncbi:hypothetical protein [Neisseria sp. Ec49-e6-T10]|uniref:hypothetical protein n=1 Tax=Neisseria sp. Ec49-e6-T10 TaxID=3140744 RepID=UPI003EB77C4C